MLLYHYTTLDSFALLLQSRKIRFSKLSTVDDPNEYGYIKDGINPAHYVFVSCWTSSSDENIPQWKMYSNGGHGVRIGLSAEMFSVKKYDGNYLNVFPGNYYEDKDYYILPILSKEKFLSEIKYQESPLLKSNIVFTTLDGNSAIDFKELGIYKSTDWLFQKEIRFRLYIVPKINGLIPNDFLRDNIVPSINYIDIPIIENVFNEMEITLGPYMTESEKVIANALINQYVKTPRVNASVFAK